MLKNKLAASASLKNRDSCSGGLVLFRVMRSSCLASGYVNNNDRTVHEKTYDLLYHLQSRVSNILLLIGEARANYSVVCERFCGNAHRVCWFCDFALQMIVSLFGLLEALSA